MKILHINFTFTFGGIETMLVNIANAQVEMGHEVHVLIVESNSVEKTLQEKFDPRIKMHFARRKAGKKDLMALFRINWCIETFAPDAIHIHGSNLYRFILDPRYKRITCSTLHALPHAGNTKAIEQVPKVFAISEAVRRDLLAFKGVDSITNPNGIRTELIAPRTKWGWVDTLNIVYVGRLDHEFKGQHILIQAAAELVNRGYRNFKVNLIGDGPSRVYLEDLCKELNVCEYVHFAGAKSQEYIFGHLKDYDLFVQASIHEGFGNTVAEAMAAKLPVIVSSGQGPEEVIDYGRLGYIFENGNAKDCADKVEIFLERKNDESMIEAAYTHVNDLYNVKNTAKRYLEGYLWRK